MRATIWFKALAHAACATPLGLIAFDIARADLGPDPVAQIEHRTGIWALRLLLATLTITPLRRITGWNVLVRYRRLLGLWAFAYACTHLATYLFLDLGAYWAQLFVEIAKRPYITVGFTAWLLLLPLAATSTQAMVRRLGRRWQQLHRLIYVSAILAALHFIWIVKSGKAIARIEPLVYAAILAALLLLRLPWSRWTRGPTSRG